jgi:hypothetical protein
MFAPAAGSRSPPSEREKLASDASAALLSDDHIKATARKGTMRPHLRVGERHWLSEPLDSGRGCCDFRYVHAPLKALRKTDSDDIQLTTIHRVFIAIQPLKSRSMSEKVMALRLVAGCARLFQNVEISLSLTVQHSKVGPRFPQPIFAHRASR